MSILIERASSEERSRFFAKNRWIISRLIGEPSSEDVAEEKPKRKRKTKAKPKAKAKAKAKSTSKAKQKKTPAVEEKKAPDPVIEAPVEAAEAVTPTASTKDDFTQIKGLGPKMAKSLYAAGITTFQALSALTPEQIATIGEDIRGFAKAYENKAFKAQAATLAC